jgi:hypothetical protein
MNKSDLGDLLDNLDFDAIADPSDKIFECRYFLNLASEELDVMKFRWQISAFLGAAYSFFEISANIAHYYALSDPRTGEPIKDSESIKVLEHYVEVTLNNKKKRVDTAASNKESLSDFHELVQQLYEVRKKNTHHYPLSIMVTGTKLPEDFHFGHNVKNSRPALIFCRSVMTLIQEVQNKLEA